MIAYFLVATLALWGLLIVMGKREGTLHSGREAVALLPRVALVVGVGCLLAWLFVALRHFTLPTDGWNAQ